MLKNEVGIATILGLLLIGLMIGGMVILTEAIRNPTTFQSRASTTFNRVNVFAPDPSPQVSPSPKFSSQPCEIDKKACFKQKSVTVSFDQASGYDTLDSNYWIIPAFKLVGKREFDYILDVENIAAGVSLESTEGSLSKLKDDPDDYGKYVNVKILKEGVKAPAIFKMKVYLNAGDRLTGYTREDQLDLTIVYNLLPENTATSSGTMR